MGKRESANTYYDSVYENQWHKTGFARQEAALEKANSENTWKHGAHENCPGEIHVILEDDMLSHCVCQEEACPEILHANLNYHPYKMQVVQQLSDADKIISQMHYLDLAMHNGHQGRLT